MHPITRFWFDAWRLGFEAQQVIGLRLVRMSHGGEPAFAEAQRMVVEKVSALMQAQQAAAQALVAGHGPEAAASRAMVPLRQKMRANRRRLSRL